MASRAAQPLTGTARAHLSSLEAHWSGSLYLQMLSHPLRKCIVTQKVLPTSLMVQLKAVTLPPSPSPTPSPSTSTSTQRIAPSTAAAPAAKAQERIVMLPDQVLHPKYVPRKVGRGVWCMLDPRVVGKMQERGSWKVVSPKAVVVQMEALVWTQLGERVVQEAELLSERFVGRKRLDLFRPSETEGRCSFAIRIPRWSEGTTEAAMQEQEDASGSTALFEPVFKDPDQAARFVTVIRGLTTSISQSDAIEERRLFYAKQSHITAPLGVALYRLNMWVSNSPTRASPARPSPHPSETAAHTSP